MAPKSWIIDPSTLDLNKVAADIEEIRRYNPQRFEMEQLTAIIHIDLPAKICVGYKDVAHDEFWVRGHMPGMPLMPGVVMCEVGAQVCSFMAQRHDMLQAGMIGFGGLEEVRFRDPVVPGDRLYMASELQKVRPKRMLVARFQGWVRDSIVVEGIIKGIPLPVEAMNAFKTSESSE